MTHKYEFTDALQKASQGAIHRDPIQSALTNAGQIHFERTSTLPPLPVDESSSGDFSVFKRYIKEKESI